MKYTQQSIYLCYAYDILRIISFSFIYFGSFFPSFSSSDNLTYSPPRSQFIFLIFIYSLFIYLWIVIAHICFFSFLYYSVFFFCFFLNNFLLLVIVSPQISFYGFARLFNETHITYTLLVFILVELVGFVVRRRCTIRWHIPVACDHKIWAIKLWQK